MWDALPCHRKVRILALSKVREYPKTDFYTFGHIFIPALSQSRLIHPEFASDAFKFAFVRNPFDRAISLFEFSKQRGTLPSGTTFQRFCEIAKSREYEPPGLYNKQGLSQLNPQCSWIKNNDTIFCDFVGRYENLQNDFNELWNLLNLQGKPSGLKWLNKSNRTDPSTYYTPKTARLIRHAYEEDFDIFKYSDII